jgi:hypothetical protein
VPGANEGASATQDLTGGAGADRIDGQDGDDNDVISCRDEIDIATADFLDAVGTDCETINRPPTGGGSGGGPGPGPGTPTPAGPARVALPRGALRVRRGRVRVRVRCVSSPTDRCRGRVSLRRRTRRRVRIFGSARYSVARGDVVTVVIALNRIARELLGRRRPFRVTLRVTIDGRIITIRR